MKRKINIRKIKANKSYSQKELIETLVIDRKTLYNWRLEGLLSIGGDYFDGKQLLFMGKDVIDFFKKLQKGRKIDVLPYELVCLKCRKGRFSQKDKLEYNSENWRSDDKITVRVAGVCTICGSKMNKSCNQEAAKELKSFYEKYRLLQMYSIKLADKASILPVEIGGNNGLIGIPLK